jgi:acyl-coenzyme A thioesterase PaaI-like protein
MKKEINLTKLKWQLFLLGVFKIPLIGFIRPQLIEINDDTVKVKIKLKRRSKNHLNSMYFGALAVGADIAGGIHTFYYGEKEGLKFSFSFKDMKADFLKRAESDVTFVSNDGSVIHQMIQKSSSTKERENKTVSVIAYNEANEVVANFEMGVSLKVK